MAVRIFGRALTVLGLSTALLLSQTSQISAQTTTETLLNQGIERFKAGDYSGAIAAYNRAIKLDPDYLEAYIARGEARRLLGDTQGAVIDSTKAIQLNPESTDAYLNRCAAYYQARRFQKAIEDCSRVITLDSQAADAYYNRALAQRELKQTIAAMNDFQQAADLYQQQLDQLQTTAPEILLQQGEPPIPEIDPTRAIPVPPIEPVPSPVRSAPTEDIRSIMAPGARGNYKPPKGRGIPGRREPAGSRSLP